MATQFHIGQCSFGYLCHSFCSFFCSFAASDKKAAVLHSLTWIVTNLLLEFCTDTNRNVFVPQI